jgi:hypothetical protein
VAHRIRHRQVQRVAFQAEVEGVAADIAGRLEPACKRELAGLTRIGTGKQAVLDLRLERKRH